MTSNNQNKPYILGLDIGMASVGAALLGDKEVIGLHVRAFNKAETDKEGNPLNQIRREARSARRRTRRKALRLQSLKKILSRGSLPYSTKTNETISPWQSRAEGLNRKLTPEEWSASLYHLLKHRGFQSTRKSEANDDKQLGELLSGVKENNSLIDGDKYRTAGELAWLHPKFSDAKRNKGGSYKHTFSRADIAKELSFLFDKQRQFGNPNASEALEEAVNKLLMARRPAIANDDLFKMIGFCTFEKEEYRSPKATFSAEKFVWLGKLNNLTINSLGKRRPLTRNERETLINLPFTLSKLSYKQVRSKLNLQEGDSFVGLSYYKKDPDSKKDPEAATLFEAKSFNTMKKAYEKRGLEGRWKTDCHNIELMDALTYAQTVYKEDAPAREYLKEKGVDEEVIEAALSVSFSGFINLSLVALQKIIPLMEQGQRYDQAVTEIYGHHSNLNSGLEKSKYLPKVDYEDIRNPVVARTLNQARKLVNAIVKQYGSPAAVHIELARDLSKPFDERRKIQKDQETYQKDKERDRKYFEEQFGSTPNGLDLLKFQLYREQDAQCAYSQKPIDIDRLCEVGYVQVDHALPFSRSFDNSKNNKVLVLTQENQNKGNKTPYEYLNGVDDSEQWQRFVAWVVGNKKIRQAKRSRLLQSTFDFENAEAFRERNLTDTRYACKYFKKLVEDNLLLDPRSKTKRVVAVSGQLTSLLRARWGLLKVREDGDKHHALDAAVVAACTQGFVKRMANYSKRKELEFVRTHVPDPETGEIIDIAALRQLEGEFPQPWPNFRNELLARLSDDPAAKMPELKGVQPIRVSRAPLRRGTGAAHKETIRSKKHMSEDIPEQKKKLSSVKTPLEKLKVKDLERIVGYEDPRNKGLITAIRQRLEAFGDNGQKAFKEPLYKPSKSGKQAPQIRSVNLLSSSEQKSGVDVRGGIADNGEIIRTDIFLSKNGFFAIPLYVADIVKPELPCKVITKGKNYQDWISINQGFKFLFSLHPNDWIRITRKGKPTIEGYYSSVNRSTAAFDVWIHDRNKQFGRKGKVGLIEGVGFKSALSIEKFHVDLLGNLHIAPYQPRQLLKQV